MGCYPSSRQQLTADGDFCTGFERPPHCLFFAASLAAVRFFVATLQVSKGQFQRALDQAGLMAPSAGAPPSDLLTVKEVEVLSKRYEVKGDGEGRRGGTQNGDVGGGGMVNYWKLCEQVEKVRSLMSKAGRRQGGKLIPLFDTPSRRISKLAGMLVVRGDLHFGNGVCSREWRNTEKKDDCAINSAGSEVSRSSTEIV